MVTRCCGTVVLTLAVAASVVGAEPQIGGQRIYVCGHSFHVMIVPPLEQMGQLARLKGHAIVGRAFLGGSTVTRHWDVPDDQSDVKKAIRAGRVDVLTLSPHPRVLPDPAIARFADLLLAANPKGRVLVQASWLGFDGQQRGTFRNEDRNRTDLKELRKATEPINQQLKTQIAELAKHYREKQGRPVVGLVPVSEAVLQLREQVAQGEVPGISRQSQLFRDEIGHPTAPIAVLAAYCHYAAIYQRSPVGLGVPDALRNGVNEKEVAALNRLLQEIAWHVVTDEPLSGVPREGRR
jgi:hypothetical protein